MWGQTLYHARCRIMSHLSLCSSCNHRQGEETYVGRQNWPTGKPSHSFSGMRKFELCSPLIVPIAGESDIGAHTMTPVLWVGPSGFQNLVYLPTNSLSGFLVDAAINIIEWIDNRQLWLNYLYTYVLLLEQLVLTHLGITI